MLFLYDVFIGYFYYVAGRQNLQLVALHDVTFSIALKKARRSIIYKARMIRREKEKIEERYLKRVRKIYEYLNFVHPSGEVLLAGWSPKISDAKWVPKLLADKKRTLVLDLNGLLVEVVESKHGQIPPTYAKEMKEYRMQDGRYVFCRNDSHQFLDWCIQFFNVYIWSTSRRLKVHAILDTVFKEQRERLAGILSQEHCRKKPWMVLNKPVFLKHLHTLWECFGRNDSLIIDDSMYKVCKNLEGTWLITPKLKDQTVEQRQRFLLDKLTPWLFLWLQSEDRSTYTASNGFHIGSDLFSDAVIAQMDLDLQEVLQATWMQMNRQTEMEASDEADRQEWESLEREVLERQRQLDRGKQ